MRQLAQAAGIQGCHSLSQFPAFAFNIHFWQSQKIASDAEKCFTADYFFSSRTLTQDFQ
jgi:hypothetical protein